MNTGIWTQRTLYTYVPEDSPEITFYYKPLAGGRQHTKRLLYTQFEFLYEYMEDVFADRVFMFGTNTGEHPRQRFLWPPGPAAQEALISNIPKSVIIEAGAQILGWTRRSHESPKEFVDRIIADLAKL